MLPTCEPFGPILGGIDVTSTTLIAANRWLSELKARTVQQASASLRIAPRYRDMTPTQYQHALEWLRGLGLVSDTRLITSLDDARLLEIVLDAYFETVRPLWVDDLDYLVTDTSELPLDAIDLAEALEIKEASLYDSAKRVAKKFDDSRQVEIGLLGETCFVEWLTANTSGTIEWVSQTDDSAGFDVLLKSPQFYREIEIKSTLARNGFRFYLSRNEYERMSRSPSWSLQMVSLVDQRIESMYWVSNEWLGEIVPLEAADARWQSLQIRVPQYALRPGVHPNIKEVAN
jgi:hypothetical protein